jgi:hypothetical protein
VEKLGYCDRVEIGDLVLEITGLGAQVVQVVEEVVKTVAEASVEELPYPKGTDGEADSV